MPTLEVEHATHFAPSPTTLCTRCHYHIQHKECTNTYITINFGKKYVRGIYDIAVSDWLNSHPFRV